MKVLIIVTTKFDMNGITNVVMNYYRNMNKKKFEFDFVVPNLPRKKIVDEIKKYDSKLFIIENRLKNPLKYMYDLNNVMKKDKYDVVHIHGNSNTLAIELSVAKYKKIPVRIPHSHNTITKFKFIHTLLSKQFKKTYTHGLACGIDAGNWLFGKENFIVLDNGINVEDYCYDEDIRKSIRNSLSFKEKNKVIGHVGHFTLQKNQNYLIELFRELYERDSSYRLILIGDGVLREELEEKVDKLGISSGIIFLGKREDIPALMSAMDILVMPSIYEGLPLTLIEAQSADLDCFISNKISQEVDVTNTINFFELSSDYSELVIKIENHFKKENNRKLRKKYFLMKESKYNITKTAVRLEHLYVDFYKETSKENKKE